MSATIEVDSKPDAQGVEHHGDGHGHPAYLQHHFVSAEQQFDAAKMGMWMFLVTEILLFSGMFVAYTVYRVWYPEVFTSAASALDWKLGALNTVILIASSLTVALAIRSIQENKQEALVRYLLITIACAFAFLIIKAIEYSAKFSHGIFPGANYSAHDLPEHFVNPIFFSIYFIMTGIHGFHVVIGIGIMIWLVVKATRGRFSAEWYTPVELSGLYWHLVDLIWIFLFPLLYLI